MAAIVNWDTILVYPENKEIGYPLHVEYTSISPNRESIILLHGYMGSIRDYEYIIHFLSDEYNIIAVDNTSSPARLYFGNTENDPAFDGSTPEKRATVLEADAFVKQ